MDATDWHDREGSISNVSLLSYEPPLWTSHQRSATTVESPSGFQGPIKKTMSTQAQPRLARKPSPPVSTKKNALSIFEMFREDSLRLSQVSNLSVRRADDVRPTDLQRNLEPETSRVVLPKEPVRSPSTRRENGKLANGKQSEGDRDRRNTMTLKDQEKTIDELQKENFGLKMQIYYLEEKLAKVSPDSIEDTINENIALKVKVQRQAQDLEKYTKMMADMNEKLAALAKRKDAEPCPFPHELAEAQAERLRETEAAYQELLAENERFEEVVQSKTRENNTLRTEIEHLRGEVESNQDMMHAKERQIDTFRSEIDQLREEGNEEQLRQKDREIRSLRSQMEKLKSQAQQREEMIQDNDRATESLQSQVDKLKQQLSARDETVNKLKNQLSARDVTVSDKELTIESLRMQLDKLKLETQLSLKLSRERTLASERGISSLPSPSPSTVRRRESKSSSYAPNPDRSNIKSYAALAERKALLLQVHRQLASLLGNDKEEPFDVDHDFNAFQAQVSDMLEQMRALTRHYADSLEQLYAYCDEEMIAIDARFNHQEDRLHDTTMLIDDLRQSQQQNALAGRKLRDVRHRCNELEKIIEYYEQLDTRYGLTKSLELKTARVLDDFERCDSLVDKCAELEKQLSKRDSMLRNALQRIAVLIEQKENMEGALFQQAIGSDEPLFVQ
ncbi:hypothetical protein BZG36_01740 [Bifiguratus adelaidae]|uniref:Centrosomin N-terminal motif 1 domain-containing protein n=1 Tax=Bifiguratus adelaidae TaxID=1938954 RepID=A0A261Y2Y5_9FUNG|nr:hypothetical protein BZG36_01740 [Bifiguratus adelaidae]